MKTAPQCNDELTRLCGLIENISVAMLTNVNAEGVLVSRPMAPLELDGEGALWFFTDQRSSKVEHLRAVNVSFVNLERGIYVSLAGRGEINTERARIERLWTPFARPWFPDGPDSANLALLKVLPEAAEYWDSEHSRMVRMFAMAASVVAGKPIGLGDHEKLTHLSK